MASDGVWDVMTGPEVCGFIIQHENRDTVAEALVQECRNRWDELNRNKKKSSNISDWPHMKFGCDDITSVVCYFNFIEENVML